MDCFKNIAKISAILAPLLFGTNSIQADNSAPNQYKGFYIGGGLGAIYQAYSIPDFNQGAFGLGVNVGYMFNPYIGVEGLYYLTPYNAPYSDPYIGSGVLTQLIQIYGGDLKLNLPLGQNFSIFAKGGYGGVTDTVKSNSPDVTVNDASTTTASKSGALIGGGFGYSINQHSEITIETDGIFLTSDGNSNDGFIGFVGVVYNYHFS